MGRNDTVADLNEVNDVRAVILIPAYGQPSLTAETLRTAVAQQCDFPFAVVVVNDGCPSPETHEICQNFASSHSGTVFYLRKANNGLSAARNTGLEFALQAFPALEAVFFLDCDNHIDPALLQRLVHALRTSDERTGWIYTDVDKFGFSSFSDMSGPYSALEHLFRSFCEAGSMVSRRMLDAGARFDEAMRKGVEDWEFWLQGLSLGFHGIHVSNAGFHYRRRGESMLTDAERDFTSILDYIRKKHSALYNVQAVLRREIENHARYAIFHPDTGQVRNLTTASKSLEPKPLDDYLTKLLRAAEKPNYANCPGHLLVMHQATYDFLATEKVLGGVLWMMECALQQAATATCTFSFGNAARFGISSRSTEMRKSGPLSVSTPVAPVHIWAVEAGALLAQQFPEGGFAFGNHWHTSKPMGTHEFKLKLDLPFAASSTLPVAPEAFHSLFERLQQVADGKERAFWHSVPLDRYRAQSSMPRDYYPELFKIPSPFPVESAEKAIAFVLDHPSAEDIARCHALAESAMQNGFIPSLVCFGSTLSAEPHDLKAFAEIILLPLSSFDETGDARYTQNYMGTDLPLLDGRDRQAALGTLSAFSAVVSVKSRVLHLLAGALRKLKVKTYAVIDGERDGASNSVVGCSAFEQAYDAVFPETPEIMHLCRAVGYPSGKLKEWNACFPAQCEPAIIKEPKQTDVLYS